MNAELIAREAHLLLQETASYEEPRLFLEESPTLAELAKRAPDLRDMEPFSKGHDKGHISDIHKPVLKSSQKLKIPWSQQVVRKQFSRFFAVKVLPI